MTRAIIVGGGPAGSTLALSLAQRGMDVRVLERARFPRDKACGEFISPLGVQCLIRTGLLDEVLTAGAQWVNRAKVVFPAGESYAAGFGIGGEDGLPIRGLSLPRRVLDSICLSAAEAEGAIVHQGFLVQGIERISISPGMGWRVTGRDRDDGPQSFECDLLVGADGVGSVVARRMGWLRPSWPQRMGITASFRSWTLEPQTIEMHLLRNAYCGVVGQADGVTHIGLAFSHRKGEGLSGQPAESALRERLAEFPGLAEKRDSAELCSSVKVFGPMGVCSRRRHGTGVLLVGDAAGFLDPVTGHGIGFALRSSELAARTVMDALRRADFSEASLQSYTRAYDRELTSSLRYFRILQRLLASPYAMQTFLIAFMNQFPGVMERLIVQSVRHSSPDTRQFIPERFAEN